MWIAGGQMEIRKERQTRTGAKARKTVQQQGKSCERWLWVKGCVAGAKAEGKRYRIHWNKLGFPPPIR